MKDPRVTLDNVRAKISPNAKLLVVWVEDGSSVLHCAQTNLDGREFEVVVESLRANALAARGLNGKASVPG